MDPRFPFKKDKKSIWQTQQNLPIGIKIAVLLFGIIVIAGIAVFWWRSATIPPPAPTISTQSEKRHGDSTNTQAGEATTETPASPEQETKKDEEAKNNPAAKSMPDAGTPTPSPPATPGSNTPNPTTPPTTPPSTGIVRPNSSNTGPTGALTSTYSGAVSNGSANQTFENTNFPTPGAPGYYIFSGNNLTLRNCHIHGNGVLFSGDNITIENCVIEGGVSLSGTNGVIFRYNEIQNFSGDGIHLTSDSGQAANVTISHNYVHDPTPACGDHADGIQIRGVNTLNLYNNTFDMGPWVQVCGQDALNAAIFFESANGGNSNLTVDSNYLNGAGITLRLNPGTNQKIINNRFGRAYRYGVISNQTSAGNITQKSGNIMDDDGSIVTF